MAIYDVTCRVVEGQPSGGVSSGKVIIEWDKTHATLIAGGGVLRSPSATSVFQNLEESGDATVVDGKVTGFASSAEARSSGRPAPPRLRSARRIPTRQSRRGRGRAVQRSLLKVIENIDFRPPKAAARRSCGSVSV